MRLLQDDPRAVRVAEEARLVEALRRRVADLEAVFGALADGVLVVDGTGHIVDINPAMLRLLDLQQREEALGPFARVVQARACRPDGSRLTRDELVTYRVLRGGAVVRGDLRVERPGGTARLLETVATPIRAADGSILGVVVSGRDVTVERKRARNVAFLAEVAGLLVSSFDARAGLEALAERCVAELADCCAVYERHRDSGALRPLVLRERDPAFTTMLRAGLGHRPLGPGEGFAGAAVREGRPILLSPLSDELIRRHHPDAREARQVQRLGLRSVVAVPLAAEDGPLGALVIGSRRDARRLDEHDRHLAVAVAGHAALAIERGRRYELLEQALARLELVLDSMSDGLVVFGTDGGVVLVNEVVRRMFEIDEDPFGWSAEALARRTAGCLERPEQIEEIVRGLHTDPELVSRLEFRLARPRACDVERVAAPVRGSDGEVLGQVVLYRDLTHIRELERIRNEGAARLSRELRMPLTAISAYGAQAHRRARQGGTDRSITRALEVILRNARQLTGLVADLVDAAAVDVGELEIAPVEVDVLALLRQAIDQARAMTTLHRFRLDAPATLSPAHWDPDRVRQAFVNILENAVRYSPDGGQIGVRLRLHEAGVLISIRDRGLGIPPDQLERVFERFYRIDDGPIRRRIHGSGLGLHLARGVVRAHGGSVWAESTGVPGQGTIVHVVLPWRPETAGSVSQ